MATNKLVALKEEGGKRYIMIKGIKLAQTMRTLAGKELKEGDWLCVDTVADNALMIINTIHSVINAIDCKIILKGFIYEDSVDCWAELRMELDCLTQGNQLQELFGGALLEEMQNRVNSAIAEFELQGVAYGVYNGNTPIFTKIESFAKAQAVFYNTAKACAILGLRCDLVNERTGEVIE